MKIQIKALLYENGKPYHGFDEDSRVIGGDGLCMTIKANYPNGFWIMENKPKRLYNIYGDDKGTGFAGNVYDSEEISPTIQTMEGGNRQPLIEDKPKLVGGIGEMKSNNGTQYYQQDRIYDSDGVALCQSAHEEFNPWYTVPEIDVIGNYSPSGHDATRVVSTDGLAPTVKENHGSVTAVPEPNTCLIQPIDRDYNKHGGEREVHIETKSDGISHTLRTNGETMVYPCLTPGRQEKRQNGPRFRGDGEDMFTLTAQDIHGVATKGGDAASLRIRKLTPKECWRLMGWDDESFSKAEKVNSNSQLYKQAGNGIVVQVLEAIFKEML